MTTFNIWTNPSTGKVRIYLNNFGHTKVWVEEQAPDCFGETYHIVAKNDNRNRSELSNIINEAEAIINEAAGKRVKLFTEVLALTSK